MRSDSCGCGSDPDASDKNLSSAPCCGDSNLNQSCCGSGSGSMGTEETVKERYGRTWKSQETSGSWQASLSEAHKVLLDELKPAKGMRVLDVGSGGGETVLAIAEKVGSTGSAVGIDLTPEGVELSKKKAEQRKLGGVAKFHVANALELPFPDSSFDAVISECVVCLIEDKQKAINEKVRVLKPNGRVIMHDVISRAPMPKVMRENEKLYCGCIGGAVGLDEYVDMMKKAGLKDIKTVDLTKSARRMLNASVLSVALELKDDGAFQEMVDFVRKGGLGYALLAGTKK